MSPPLARAALEPAPFYVSGDGAFRLYQGDALGLLPSLEAARQADMVFADPPYFLSNGGITCHAGRMVPVHKGNWDRLASVDEMHQFNRSWLEACRGALQPDGTIWVSGTRHVIFSVGLAMQQLGMKLLNDIVWEKPNPPPNLSCRYFTHATETLLWAANTARSKHKFDYPRMRELAGGKQMKSVWRIGAPGRQEKALGHHPTQKPLALLERIVLAATAPGDLVVDPFAGSGTTGLAAVRHGRRFVGIDLDPEYLTLAVQRYEALTT